MLHLIGFEYKWTLKQNMASWLSLYTCSCGLIKRFFFSPAIPFLYVTWEVHNSSSEVIYLEDKVKIPGWKLLFKKKFWKTFFLILEFFKIWQFTLKYREVCYFKKKKEMKKKQITWKPKKQLSSEGKIDREVTD